MFRQILCAAIALTCFASTSAFAVELSLSSNASEIPQAQVREVIALNIPPQVAQLGAGYKLFAVMETSDFRPGERLYSYSVQLHKKVIEAVTGKEYWVMTGGIRGHGVAVASETILSNLKGDIVAGAQSFKLDQE
ncbi:hypothetical protein [Pseudomonas abietaniphila]|uniref:Uncharacterized protein n=1 Tax=Pseudomonas abietaniphila TaxID=89065 RepID=A0A1G8QX92_9PSED|nr:hypothetical protein [Pseudomonas abietaniphila]SDJ08935.1 hypothetical protein SAMN05216605_12183 [Pseudomonas abietaniphila]